MCSHCCVDRVWGKGFDGSLRSGMIVSRMLIFSSAHYTTVVYSERWQNSILAIFLKFYFKQYFSQFSFIESEGMEIVQVTKLRTASAEFSSS